MLSSFALKQRTLDLCLFSFYRTTMKNEAYYTTELLTKAALLDIEAGWLESMVNYRIDRDSAMVEEKLKDATRHGAIEMQQDEQKRLGNGEPEIPTLPKQLTPIDPRCVYRHIRALRERAASYRDQVPAV